MKYICEEIEKQRKIKTLMSNLGRILYENKEIDILKAIKDFLDGGEDKIGSN